MQQIKIENIEIEFYTSFHEWDVHVASKSIDKNIYMPCETMKSEAVYDVEQDKILVYYSDRAEFKDLFSVVAKAIGSTCALDQRFISRTKKGKHYEEFAMQTWNITNVLLNLIPDWEPIGEKMFYKKKIAFSRALFPLASYYCGNDIFVFQNNNRTWNFIRIQMQNDKKIMQSFEFQLRTHQQFQNALEKIKNTSTDENIS